ncbi:hypothetical protein [Pseudomonas synxantha]|uniref:hypothetical protein n=1 Tax=Pseudomonas synxantha TaxID=47883 RepID=UPI00345DF18A
MHKTKPILNDREMPEKPIRATNIAIKINIRISPCKRPGTGQNLPLRAINSASSPSRNPAAKTLIALLVQRGHWVKYSPAPNASLRGATVFFHWQSRHTNISGLGFIGIAVLLKTYP